MYYGFDLVMLIPTLVIVLGSQFYINSTYKKTLKIHAKSNMTGADVARTILDNNGLEDVRVVETNGILSDHYDPGQKTIRLSQDIYRKSSVASISVAAHECGHAIQHKNNYQFLIIRNNIIPFVNLSSIAGYIAITAGIFSSLTGLIFIGIIFEVIILLFQLITLPVEFNASSTALNELNKLKILDNKEIKSSKKMLKAAALTYVASVATALLEIIRLILITQSRDNN